MVFRSRRHDELYVFVPENQEIDDLPESLRRLTGPLEHAMDLELTPDRVLARSDINAVLAGLRDPGYYVQMPPNPIKPTLYNGE
ncbi:YcgL domain-containing protein [uncultured Abyssibacter sp.]|uniref:YcgL domain-containing protein n=1 Tax=uncultured Abyssibacter sp. TaxID=2320202 RepID=UPI0032B1B744